MNLVRLGGTLVGTASLLAAAGTTTRAQGVVAVRGATVHTAAGAPIAGATILVRDGKIAAVGRDVAIPAGATIIDATGKVSTPGMPWYLSMKTSPGSALGGSIFLPPLYKSKVSPCMLRWVTSIGVRGSRSGSAGGEPCFAVPPEPPVVA